MRAVVPAAILIAVLPRLAQAQIYASNLPKDDPAIHYMSGPLGDPVAHLAKQLESGKVKLDLRAGPLGYLPSLLQHLGIHADSQALVFSKTSFQAGKISPRNPRAIYFSDDVAVGWVRGGDGMEIATQDPQQGTVFYTLNTSGAPALTRRDVCLKCHQGPATLGVPGIFVGSVYPNMYGEPDRSGAIITDHRTAFADRWGGWYVNATHGEQKDRANAVAPDPAEPEALNTDGARNLTSLLARFDTSSYLTPISDIVALMTFEHQTQMSNYITRVNWQTRLGDPKSDIEPLVDYMLFADEAPLVEPIEGVSTFTSTFPKLGPRDGKGRSLRDFDLHTRLFRYPLSYMIYSAAFDGLPAAARERIYERLYQVLTGKDQSPKFAKLTKEDRRAIFEIVAATKKGLPGYWNSGF